MRGVGRDGLMIEIQEEQPADWSLSITRDGRTRLERWPSRAAAVTRAQQLLVTWDTDSTCPVI